MAKSIKKNYFFNLFYQILTIITPLITAPYVSRILDPDGIGLQSYANSIVSYFIMFASLGIASFAQREIAYDQDNREKRTEVFWNAKALSLITSLISTVIYILLVHFVYKDSIIFYILGIQLLTVFFNISWVFWGMEDFGRIILRNTIIKILQISSIFIFIHKKEDLPMYCFIYAGYEFLGNVVLWPILHKYIGKPDFKNIHPFSNIKQIIGLFVPTIAISIYTVLDKTMIGIITTGDYENGYYEQALKISRMLLPIVSSLGSVMIPRIGNLFGKKDYEQVQNYMYKSYRFVWFLAFPMYFGLFAVAPNFVPWFFGPGYEKVIPLLRILGLLLLSIGINNVTGIQYLIPSKRENLFTLTVIIGACVNFVMNLILIPRFYSEGAAVASVAAETVIAIVQLVIVRKELKWYKILLSGVKYLIAGLIMFAAVYFTAKYFTPTIVHTFILVAEGVVIYPLMLFIMRDSFFIECCNTVLRKLHIKK